jgi:DNA polymerase/3'-5' exonuclease PolX
MSPQGQGLNALEGISDDLAEQIPEMVHTGRPRSLIKEAASFPPHSALELSPMPRIGSKQAMRQARHLAPV